MTRLFPTLLLLFFLTSLSAQITYPRNGVYDERDGLYAFTNATVHVTADRVVENATLLIRDGKVVEVGTNVTIPKNAIRRDLRGKTIYPAFVELLSDYGIPEEKRESGGSWRSRRPQFVSKKPGAFSWNEALRSEYSAVEHFNPNAKKAAEWRKAGFGAVLTHNMDGIARGSASMVLLDDESANETIIDQQTAHVFSFRKGSSQQDYPSSLTGTIALLRQAYMDANWYAKGGNKEETNLSLEAFQASKSVPNIFVVGDKLDVLRADKIGDEFGQQYIIRGGGDSYQRAAEIKATKAPIIVPVDFPKAYDVENPYDARMISLAQMKHWELAPENAHMLQQAGITIAFTSDGLKKKGDYLSNVRTAVERGLDKKAALRAMTETPARLVNMDQRVGSLQRGRFANFIVTDGDLFDKKTKIYQTWVAGTGTTHMDFPEMATEGVYRLSIGNESYDLHVTNTDNKTSMKIKVNDTTDLKVKHTLSNGNLTMSFSPEEDAGRIRLVGNVNDGARWSGNAHLPDGSWEKWNAQMTRAVPDKKEKKKKDDKKEAEEHEHDHGALTYPFVAYGNPKIPEAQRVLFKNASTVWTNESEGILENADVLIADGKIVSVGQNLNDGGATVIDASGMHLTSGVIDEHSHIAISRGVNEGTQASSAEVRMKDVVNSEDINIYRQLAGGVTVSQLLHGSANPIGGRSAIIKLRWGHTPENMIFRAAPPFIKFALGENVKQTNWGDSQTERYPQTRMGVEQVFVDYFTRAREYEARKNSGQPYREDMELETILQIMKGERFISCHSYQQGEINMLMKVAEQFGFRVNTFTHILEGYKVADKMAAHGAAGSTFSDWWAYKYEVIDAIPYNGALMHRAGVLTAFNSDDAEMARRLNQEAAKAVMYGNLSEEEAWKFVTLNPAKMLHVDERVGSLKPGKDADIVLWSDHPMSVYARAEQTWIDGVKYWDRTEDREKQTEVARERARLIQKMMGEKKAGKPTQPARGMHMEVHRCDDKEHPHGR